MGVCMICCPIGGGENSPKVGTARDRLPKCIALRHRGATRIPAQTICQAARVDIKKQKARLPRPVTPSPDDEAEGGELGPIRDVRGLIRIALGNSGTSD